MKFAEVYASIPDFYFSCKVKHLQVLHLICGIIRYSLVDNEHRNMHELIFSKRM